MTSIFVESKNFGMGDILFLIWHVRLSVCPYKFVDLKKVRAKNLKIAIYVILMHA